MSASWICMINTNRISFIHTSSLICLIHCWKPLASVWGIPYTFYSFLVGGVSVYVHLLSQMLHPPVMGTVIAPSVQWWSLFLSHTFTQTFICVFYLTVNISHIVNIYIYFLFRLFFCVNNKTTMVLSFERSSASLVGLRCPANQELFSCYSPCWDHVS